MSDPNTAKEEKRSRSRSPKPSGEEAPSNIEQFPPNPGETRQQQYARLMDPKRPSAIRFCSYWGAPGGCRKGVHCNFIHVNVCSDFAATGSCPKGDTCEKVHVAKKAEVCRFYTTPRGCFRGVTCDFQHPAMPPPGYTGYPPYPPSSSPPTAAPYASYHPLDVRNSPSGQPPPIDRSRMCHYFNTREGCRRGNSCPYIHVAPGQESGPPNSGYPPYPLPYPPPISSVAAASNSPYSSYPASGYPPPSTPPIGPAPASASGYPPPSAGGSPAPYDPQAQAQYNQQYAQWQSQYAQWQQQQAQQPQNAQAQPAYGAPSVSPSMDYYRRP